MTNHNSENVIHRRGFMITSVLLITGCVTPSAIRSPKILFLCQAGTAKSPIAREILRRRAKERGIAVDVYSRGILLADHVSPQLKDRLLADGIDTTAEQATQLKPADLAAADIVVNFNLLPDSVKHSDVRDWTDVPSVNDDYANARAVMDKRIDALLTEISGRK